MLNITAHGRLGKDPELKQANGEQIAVFTLAANTGKDETTWMNCTVWGKRSQTVVQYIRKGSAITVAGQAKLNTYTNKDGVEKQSLNVYVNDFTLPVRGDNATDSDMPF